MIQVVALLSVFGLGIAFSIIGAVKLELAKRLQIDDAKVGGLISALMFTSVFMVLLIGPLVDSLGYKPIAIVGFILTAVCLYMLASAKSYPSALLACLLLGIGAMCINTVGNTLVSKVFFTGDPAAGINPNPAAALNLGNTFFGLGAFITPFLIGLLLKRLGYSTTVSIIGTILLLSVIFAIITAYPSIPSGFSIGSAFGLLGNKIVLLVSLALFCYISLEVSMGGWITTYLTSLKFSPERANTTLSLFWIGLMVARLISSAFVTPANGILVISLLAIVAAITITIMVMAKSQMVAALVVILTGFAFGPIFPTLVGVTFANVDQGLQGSAFGIIFAIGLLGGSTVPAAIGIYSKGKSIQKALLIAVAASILLFVIARIIALV